MFTRKMKLHVSVVQTESVSRCKKWGGSFHMCRRSSHNWDFSLSLSRARLLSLYLAIWFWFWLTFPLSLVCVVGFGSFFLHITSYCFRGLTLSLSIGILVLAIKWMGSINRQKAYFNTCNRDISRNGCACGDGMWHNAINAFRVTCNVTHEAQREQATVTATATTTQMLRLIDMVCVYSIRFTSNVVAPFVSLSIFQLFRFFFSGGFHLKLNAKSCACHKTTISNIKYFKCRAKHTNLYTHTHPFKYYFKFRGNILILKIDQSIFICGVLAAFNLTAEPPSIFVFSFRPVRPGFCCLCIFPNMKTKSNGL